jgi:ABC-type phosphate transport system substrate-binding protein
MRSARGWCVVFGIALAIAVFSALAPNVEVAAAQTTNGATTRRSAFIVIVNEQNTAPAVSRVVVSRFFLKKVARWDNGSTVLPVDLPATSPTRDAFSREVLSKSVSAIKAYWQQQIFSGRDVPPPEKRDDASVLEFVQSNATAIAYVSAGTALPRGVRELTVTN